MADPFFPTNSLVKRYRETLERKGKRDPRTDLQLTVELGNQLREAGDFDTEKKFPDFREQYLAATQSTDRSIVGEVGAGIERGARGLAATAVGATALGLDLIGADETAKSVAQSARNLEGGGPAPTVARMGDVTGVESGARYAAGKVGEVIPSIAESILTAMIGAAAGSGAAPGAGTAAGGIAGLVGKRAVKEMIRRGVAKQLLGKEVTEEVLEQTLRAGTNKVLQAEFVGAARNIAARMGGGATSALNSLALSAGENYNATGNAGLSLAAGAVAAAPDTILPAMILRRFFPAGTAVDAAKATGFFRRLAVDAAKTVPVEATTEAFQELVNIAAEKYQRGEAPTLTAPDIERLKESAVSGAFGGGVAAPIAAAPNPNPTRAPAAAPAVDPAIEARRRAATMTPAPTTRPAVVAPAPVRSPVQAAVMMTPQQQRIRLDALDKISTRTKDEEAERDVLRSALGIPAAPKPTSPAQPATATPSPTQPGSGQSTIVVPPGPAPRPAASVPVVSAPTTFTLPSSIAGAKPRYGYGDKQFTLSFQQDLDKALYILAGDTRSKSDALYLNAVKSQLGMSEGEARTAGAVVRARIKELAKNASGGGELNIPPFTTRGRTQPAAPATPAQPAPIPVPAPTATPPVATPAPAAAVATPSPLQLSARIQAAGRKLSQIVSQVPSVDTSSVLEKLTAVNSAKQVSVQDVEAIETSVQILETQATAEAASKAAERASKVKATAESRAKAKDIRLNKAQEAAAKKLEKALAAAAKKAEVAPAPGAEVPAQPPTQNSEQPAAPVEPAATPPGTPVTAPAPVVDDLKERLKSALNPEPTPAPTAGKPFSYGKVTLQSADLRPALTQDSEGKARELNPEALKAVDWEKVIDVKGALGDSGDRSKTRVAVALLAPDGKVVLTGLTPYNKGDGLKRIGEASGKATGPAVQRMGALKGKLKQNKIVAQGGKELVLLNDVVAAGYVPIARVNFEADPGVIYEEFATATDFDAAWNSTEKVGKTTAVTESAAAQSLPTNVFAQGDNAVAAAQAEAASTVDPAIDEAGIDAAWAAEDAAKKSAAPRSRGQPLPNVGRVDNAFFEKIHEQLVKAGGKFDAKFLRGLTTKNQTAITKLFGVTKMVDYEDFSRRIQSSFEAAENAAEFASFLKGEVARTESPESRPATQAVGNARFGAVVDRLGRAGIDVAIVQRELGSNVAGSYNPQTRQITLAMEDVANANLGNLVTLLHEVGHDLVRSSNVQMQDRLARAVTNTLPAVRAIKEGGSPEERLVETMALKLTEEGFGEQASTLAQTIVRTIKDLYLRVAMAVQTALGIQPSDSLSLAWFENNLRRMVGGDFDYRFTDLFRTLLPEPVADRVRRFTRIDGPGVANYLDPFTRSITQPVALPDTVEAATANLILNREENDYTEAMARVQVAGLAELMPVLQSVKQAVAPTLTDAQFWKLFARGDLPSDIVAAIEQRVPGAGTATIGGENMTDPMNQRARYNAFRMANALAAQARRRAASKREASKHAAQDIVDAARRLSKVDRAFRDADAMNVAFNEELKVMLKEFAADLDRGANTAFAAGKLLGAVREVEGLASDQAIPEEYQRVFKTALDSEGMSLFEYLSAIAKLDLSLGRMTVTEIIEEIRKNAAADPRLQSLTQRRPMMVALASLAKQSARDMDLLQLRVMKDTAMYLAIRKELDEVREATDSQLDALAKAWKVAQGNQGLRDRLRKEYIDARREFRSKQRVIQRAEETAMIATEVADRMAEKSVELSRDVGAFSYWEPRNGAVYKAMTRGANGEWVSTDRTLRMVGPDVTEQFEQVRHDLILNRHWLEANAANKGSRLYEEVKRQTDELSMLDLSRQYQAAHRHWLDKMLAPIGQKFASTGTPAGARVQQMLNRFQFITRTHADEVEAKARKWTKSLQDASSAAGFVFEKQFFNEVYDHVLYAIESQPGFDEARAIREGVRVARARIPAGFKVADDFNEKLGTLLRQTKETNEALLKIAEDNGVYIEDRRIKDPLTQKSNLLRHAIKYGWLTNSRKLRANVVQTLVYDMTKAGWSDELFAEIDAAAMDDAQAQELTSTYFTPAVVRDFVQPFVYKPGKEVFFGAADSQGARTSITQLEAQEAWEKAGGDVLAFMDELWARTAQQDGETQAEFRAAMLQRFGDLYRMESKLAAETSVVKSLYDPHGPKPHRLMDGRTNDIIPPEHFEYDVFDPTSARLALAEIAFHASFGRNGNGLDETLTDVKSDLAEQKRRWDLLPVGSARLKKEAAEARGWNYNQLKRASENLQRVDGWMNELGTYFGGGNQGGAIGDARALLELMNLNMALVLNQPKSGLWNVLSLADFPVVFRGLGKTSAKSMGWAAQSLAKGMFGSALEAVGINVLRAGDYAKEIGEVFEGRQTERLPYGVMVADIGKGGQYNDGGVAEKVIQGTRAIQQTLKKGVKIGPGQGQFAGFNALWAPFNFINQQVASSIATANVQAFEGVIKRGVDYYAAHPEAFDDPAFRFTAEQLGMKGPAWFTDEGAFDFFRNKAMEYRIGSLEDIARGAATRQANGERLLTRDQALGAALMAVNEISLESGVNSRPIEFFNNPILRLGGLLMGWPLAKMNQVNESLRTKDGQLEMMSVLKGAGVLAAWALPIGLAYSLMMDWYDEDILGKKSNLRGIDTLAAVPLIGPALAVVGAGERSGTENLMGILERTARAGNVYGMGADAISSLVNVVDPSSGQREFSLDSRVLIFSQFANLRDTIRNFVQSDGTVTYQTVGRPLIATAGGNGLLQYQQILNNLLGLDNNEARVTNRINVNSWLRAAGREVGLPVRAGAGGSAPTPVSVWVREMQLNAMANDRVGFQQAYRNAIDASRRDGEPEPEKKVLASWKARNPLLATFQGKPTDTEVAKMMAVMSEDGRRAVREAMMLHESFTEMIAPSPIVTAIQSRMQSAQRQAQPLTPEQIRRRAASMSLGFGR